MKIVRRNSSYYPTFPSLVDGFLSTNWLDWNNFETSGNQKVPAVNVKEDKDGYHLELAAPGLKKEDFKIEIKEDVLTISFEGHKDQKEDVDGYTRREFSQSNFARSFNLPSNEVDIEKVEAKYENGILNLELPKREEVKVEKHKIIEIA